jgi:hypothetical protein
VCVDPKKVGLIVGVLLLLLGSVGVAAMRHWQIQRVEPFAPRGRQFLELALAEDSLGLAALALDDRAVEQALTLRREYPQRLETALRTMRLDGGVLEADRVMLLYDTAVPWCAGAAGDTDLQIQLVRVGNTWKVEFAGPGIC